MPRSSERTRLSRAARLATSRAKLVAKISEVQKKIASLTPVDYVRKQLLAGNVGSEWFIQRLLDMGLSLQKAFDIFYDVRNGPGGQNIVDVNIEDYNSATLPYTRRVKGMPKITCAQPKLKVLRNVYAPHLTMPACQCNVRGAE